MKWGREPHFNFLEGIMEVTEILIHALEKSKKLYSISSENDKTIEFGYKGKEYKLTIEKVE